MDIQNMHIGVKLGLDKSSSLVLPVFEADEIDYWLNKAIRKFVKTRYSGLNPKGKGFEQNQKRTDDLRTLIVTDTIDVTPLATGNLSDYGAVFSIPTDYWFALQEGAGITVSASVGEIRVGITECTYDEYTRKIEDPFSEHKVHYGTAKPLRLFDNAQVELITDGTYTVSHYYLTYLKKPDTVDNVPAGTTDCDLPEHTHDEIVEIAVGMILENIESPRLQTHANEVNTME